MAKKKKTVKPQREPTKRQLSRWQQQKKRQRIILSVGIFTIAAVLVLVLLGWYFGQYKPDDTNFAQIICPGAGKGSGRGSGFAL